MNGLCGQRIFNLINHMDNILFSLDIFCYLKFVRSFIRANVCISVCLRARTSEREKVKVIVGVGMFRRNCSKAAEKK